MKNLFRASKVKVGVLVAVAVTALGVGGLGLAGALGNFGLKPSSSSVKNGNNVTFSVNLNAGTPVNGVEATVTYDKSKLQFVSVSGAGSPFTFELPTSAQTDDGTIEIARGILGSSVSGNALVAKVTFKAKSGSGTASVSVDGNATSATDGNYTDPSKASLSVTLTSPSPSSTPPSGGSGDSGSSGGGSGDSGDGSGGGSTGGGSGDNNNGEGGSSSDDAGFHITGITQVKIAYTKAVLKITADKKVEAWVQYGPAKDQMRVYSSVTKFGTEHTVRLKDSVIVPGTTFYYQVTIRDENGKRVTSDVQSFKAKGYTIRVTVQDKDLRPVRKKKVTLFSDPVTGTTDEAGSVTFEDVAPGQHHVEYVQGGQKYSQSIIVKDPVISEDDNGEQRAEVANYSATLTNLAAVNYTSSLVMPAAIAVAALAVIGAGTFVLIRRKQNAFAPSAANPYAPTGGPSSPPTTPEELLHQAHGPEKPDPGSVVSPNHDDKEDN